jgi:hypothetical protein
LLASKANPPLPSPNSAFPLPCFACLKQSLPALKAGRGGSRGGEDRLENNIKIKTGLPLYKKITKYIFF